MPWSGTGSFNRDNGTFTGPTLWAQDKAAGTLITTTNHDTHDEDLADGINACLTKNGENAPSADLPMGSFVHTGVGNATARTNYASVASLQDNGHVYAADTGAADVYAVSLAPSIGAYAVGQKVIFKAANASTGASTLNVNALGAKAIKKNVSEALAADDILAGGIYEVVYDGTNFLLGLPGRDFGSTGIQADVIAESTAAAGVTADGVLLKDGAITVAAVTATAASTFQDNVSVEGQIHSDTTTLTSGASVAWDLDGGNSAVLTLGDNATLQTPSNMKDGGNYTLKIIQGAGAFTLDYATTYFFPNDTKPTASTGNGNFDIMRCWSDGTRMFCNYDNFYGTG